MVIIIIIDNADVNLRKHKYIPSDVLAVNVDCGRVTVGVVLLDATVVVVMTPAVVLVTGSRTLQFVN